MLGWSRLEVNLGFHFDTWGKGMWLFYKASEISTLAPNVHRGPLLGGASERVAAARCHRRPAAATTFAQAQCAL